MTEHVGGTAEWNGDGKSSNLDYLFTIDLLLDDVYSHVPIGSDDRRTVVFYFTTSEIPRRDENAPYIRFISTDHTMTSERFQHILWIREFRWLTVAYYWELERDTSLNTIWYNVPQGKHTIGSKGSVLREAR